MKVLIALFLVFAVFSQVSSGLSLDDAILSKISEAQTEIATKESNSQTNASQIQSMLIPIGSGADRIIGSSTHHNKTNDVPKEEVVIINDMRGDHQAVAQAENKIVVQTENPIVGLPQTQNFETKEFVAEYFQIGKFFRRKKGNPPASE
mmetsp:Transcript_55067/g.63337  ORF Transcript_55067/g.63337 Transcript_55067/m.63337 type:complete len:149 (-) Transcript_55067:144-590(-)